MTKVNLAKGAKQWHITNGKPALALCIGYANTKIG